MKKTTLATTAALLAAIATLAPAACAQDGVGPVYGAGAEYSSGYYGPYVSFKIGGALGGLNISGAEDWDFDPLFGGSGAIGYEVNDTLRFELEFGGYTGDVEDYDDVTADIFQISFQAYLSVPLSRNVSIFFNAGIGGLNCELETGTGEWYMTAEQHYDWWDGSYLSYKPREVKAKEDASFFFWNAGAGIEFWLNDRITLDISGRYLGTTKSDFGGASDVSVELYGIWVGARFVF